MKMIEDDGGMGKMVQHRAHVCGGHVDGDGLDRCGRMAQSFPEGFEGIGPLAVPDEYDGAAFEVERHGDIVMPFAYRDLIDGQVPEVFQ